jgi:hypothetical protein
MDYSNNSVFVGRPRQKDPPNKRRASVDVGREGKGTAGLVAAVPLVGETVN